MGDIVQLRSPIDLTSDRGRAFIVDATRAAESVISDQDLASKYDLSPMDLRNIAKDPAVGKAIRAERESRLRSGRAARELAAKAFVKAPAVLDTIMTSADSPKHKIDAIRELRATANGSSDDGPSQTEKFTIIINLGEQTERYEADITPKKSPQIDLEQDDGNQWG